MSARALAPADFGSFEAQLHASFEEAFGFCWLRSKREPRGAAALRETFERVTRQAMAEPPSEPVVALDLLSQAYELRASIARYVDPSLGFLERIQRLAAQAAMIGQQLARVRRSLDERRPRAASRSARLRQVTSHADAALESCRRAVDRLDRPERGVDDSERALARVVDVAVNAQGDLHEARTELDRAGDVLRGCESVVERDRLTQIEQIARSADGVAAALGRLVEDARATHLPPPSWQPYFQRLTRDLLVRAETIADALPPRQVEARYEVPRAALVVRRDRAAVRDTLAAWLATFHPEFFSALPASARRDHGAPATVGGSGNQNRVLRGVASALVLLAVVDCEPGDEGVTGEALFLRVLKRIAQSLARDGARGRVAVDASAKVPQVTQTLVEIRGELREALCRADFVRPPLVEELEVLRLAPRYLHGPPPPTVEVPPRSGQMGQRPSEDQGA